MYDNIDFILSNEQGLEINYLLTTPKYLTTITNQGINQFGKYITGYLDNLKISITENKVKIGDGSLCKYYLGDNFKTLTRGDTKRAIEKIGNCLHLPLDQANITRIDFSKNFIMKYPEDSYYKYLGEAQYYKRLEQNNGLYYNNGLRQLLFYGKVYEQKIKRQPIPELYKDRNLLRFEMRFRKRLRDQFKQTNLSAKLLYEESFYKNLVERWKNEYLTIQKINSKLINMKPTGSTKDLIECMALMQIQEIGQPQVLAIIKEWQNGGIITKKQAKDQRSKIKQLCQIPILEEQNELINELNRKVKDAARFW